MVTPSERSCTICEGRSRTGYACANCLTRLRDLVVRAGISAMVDGQWRMSLLDELDLTMSRRPPALRSPDGGGRPQIPLPFDPRASRAHTGLAYCLATWARAFGAVGATAAGAPRMSARHLAANIDELGMFEDVGGFHDDLSRAVREALDVLDNPWPVMYAGMCSAPVPLSSRNPEGYCTAILYADDRAEHLTCAGCGAVHSVNQRRVVMLEAVEEVLASATDIARTDGVLGDIVTSARIWQWERRGLLLPRGVNVAGELVYRVGDVLDLARARSSGSPVA